MLELFIPWRLVPLTFHRLKRLENQLPSSGIGGEIDSAEQLFDALGYDMASF